MQEKGQAMVVNTSVKQFFARSESLDRMVLRPLSHILGNWELTWNNTAQEYAEEEGSIAEELNALINQLEHIVPPLKYHDHEDRLVEYAIRELKWSVTKNRGRWNFKDYPYILERGSFKDINQVDLYQAVAGRVYAALQRKQFHFDDMEEGHQKILAAVLSIILYHRG